MATLSSAELQAVRNACAETIPVNYTKAELNAVAQAIENFLVSEAPALSSAIDAVKPGLTAAQKKKIVAEVLRAKFLRDR